MAGIADKTLAREIDLLPDLPGKAGYLGACSRRWCGLEQGRKGFNVFRANVDGKEMADSEVRKVLKESKDPNRRKAVWEASKLVGAKVSSDLRELVKLRNQAAQKLGFKNFHALQLYLNEQNGDEIINLFDELDGLTREPFVAAKAEMDLKLAKDCGIQPDALMPWHYHDPFFQEAPSVFASNLDTPYAKADLLQLVRSFYTSIGLPIDDVIARSDLYEKPGKSPHAFCTDIDREGDARAGEHRQQRILDGHAAS